MGLPVFSDISSGVIPMIIINIVMSIASIKHALHTLSQVVGLMHRNEGRDTISDDYICSSFMLPDGYTEEIRQALPVTPYIENLNEAEAECAVCLCEFQKCQEVRQLPHCRHIFHRGCLDKWLDHQHITCPLCRVSLVPDQISRKQLQKEQHHFNFLSFGDSELQSLWCHM